jgi:hypothetical protein
MTLSPIVDLEATAVTPLARFSSYDLAEAIAADILRMVA